MFRFEHSTYLFFLALIPLLAVFFFIAQRYRKKAIQRFGDSRLMDRLMPERSRYKHELKFLLLSLCIASLVVAWANPQWGTKKEKVNRKGIDLFIALDISESMLAQDVTPSRLLRARKFAQDLIDNVKGDNVGAVFFACNAYMQVPLTADYAFAEMFISTADPGMAPSQGTAIGEAIDVSARSFKEDNKNHKALIIISDGEDHDGNAIESAKAAHDDGLLIYTVGVGSSDGAFIPIQVQGRSDFKRDESGNPVRSQLNEEMLKNVADAGGGVYFNLAAGSEKVAESLQEHIDAIEKQEFEQRVFNEYESYFQWFVGLAIVFLLAEFLLSYRKNKYLASRDLFS
ncbi:MAG: VWA domain-containing protein [Saprospiraceae bacterium]|nr:VWA domain-containing protein [Saprospiraceae bacterium]MCB9325067.1 VWA domain-containing protein [Lewinellaceae bacterium]